MNKKCQYCEDPCSKTWEISISISAPCWMSNGHIRVCWECKDLYLENKLPIWDSDANYKRFGNLYCPDRPVNKSIKTFANGYKKKDFTGKMVCGRSCFDSRFVPLDSCKCITCQTKRKWMKAYKDKRLTPYNFKYPVYEDYK